MDRRARGRFCLIAASILVLSACSSGGTGGQPGQGEDRSGGKGVAQGGGLDGFYGQKLKWSPCPQADIPKNSKLKFQCARMRVPLDYSKPDGDTIKIALNRIRAGNQKKRIGSLVTNPGGPGESGLEMVYSASVFFTPALMAHYDIVGMDPRGVGKSSPVECLTAAEAAKLETKPANPVKQAKEFVQGCKRKSGKILPYVGTNNTVRDLDILREVLGEQKLNYIGFSYGTVLGQFYANSFPDNTGRMVLDSVANPVGWPGDPSAQAEAFEAALRVFVERCTSREQCPMGSDPAQIVAKVEDLVEQTAKQPLKSGKNSPPITSETVLEVLTQAMYKEQDWPELAPALAAAFKGKGAPLIKFSGAGKAAPQGDAEVSGSQEAIQCLHMPPEQRSIKAVKQDTEEATEAAPIFGAMSVSENMKCAVWPVKSLPMAGKPIAAKGAPTILLVQNRHDAATPVQWARGVNAQLAKSVLATNSGSGHGFYPKGPCTKRVVDSYLIDGKLPAEGTTCNDHGGPAAN